MSKGKSNFAPFYKTFYAPRNLKDCQALLLGKQHGLWEFKRVDYPVKNPHMLRAIRVTQKRGEEFQADIKFTPYSEKVTEVQIKADRTLLIMTIAFYLIFLASWLTWYILNQEGLEVGLLLLIISLVIAMYGVYWLRHSERELYQYLSTLLGTEEKYRYFEPEPKS